MTFRKLAETYKERHAIAKGLALADTIDYRLKPLLERFGNAPISDIRTADVEDFIADLKKPRIVNGLEGRKLTPASVNRTTGLLRHMLNWAVGREYLERTPFRRGTEVLIRLEREDNKRRRRVSEEEESALPAVASPHLRSMIIAARRSSAWKEANRSTLVRLKPDATYAEFAGLKPCATYERGKTRSMSRTEFQVFFKFQPFSASPTALNPHRESSEVTDLLHVGMW